MPARIAALAALVALCAACKGRGPAPEAKFIARGHGVTVTASDLKARLAEQSPLSRAYGGTLENKKDLLESVIRFELLAKEAEEQGLDRDPEVRAALKKFMVQKLVRKALGEREAPGAAAGPDDRRKALEDRILQLRARAEIEVDLVALEGAELGGAPRAGLVGHSVPAKP